MAHPPKDKSIERLRSMRNTIEELLHLPRFSPEYERWRRNTSIAIANTFRDEPHYTEEFNRIEYTSKVAYFGMPDQIDQRAYEEGLGFAAAMLDSMIDEIKEYWVQDHDIPASNTSEAGLILTNKVFVVHGKDDGTKETVARFLTKLGLDPVILHEQPNQGRTIVEKFEQYASVGFAVVLLTPDDLCQHPDDSEGSRYRARQNVILELGFFLGKLGRNRTFVLRKDNVEIPSDYDGVLYTPIDDRGAWRMQLVREIKEAGIEVDANLAL
ncbi:MAG: nucleotide-binding protein [Chloroflexi bacterium]|nr:nucleotide-binding protein [Chloroflexota bacterium]